MHSQTCFLGGWENSFYKIQNIPHIYIAVLPHMQHQLWLQENRTAAKFQGSEAPCGQWPVRGSPRVPEYSIITKSIPSPTPQPTWMGWARNQVRGGKQGRYRMCADCGQQKTGRLRSNTHKNKHAGTTSCPKTDIENPSYHLTKLWVQKHQPWGHWWPEQGPGVQLVLTGKA